MLYYDIILYNIILYYIILYYRNSETSGYPTRCFMQLVQSSGVNLRLTPDECTSCMKHRVG